MTTPACVLVIAFAVAVAAGCETAGRAPAPDADADSSAPAPVALDSTGPGGAVDVIRRYYEAIDTGDYAAAYALWAQDGAASGQAYEAFAAGFAQTARSGVEITGPVVMEGAAGSSFAEVPVRVRATTRSGEDQQFEGTYVVRRVNDVPGATPAQLRWHIHEARLHQ